MEIMQRTKNIVAESWRYMIAMWIKLLGYAVLVAVMISKPTRGSFRTRACAVNLHIQISDVDSARPFSLLSTSTSLHNACSILLDSCPTLFALPTLLDACLCALLTRTTTILRDACTHLPPSAPLCFDASHRRGLPFSNKHDNDRQAEETGNPDHGRFEDLEDQRRHWSAYMCISFRKK